LAIKKRGNLEAVGWRVAATLAVAALLALGGLEVGQVAWGSGHWLGRISLKWGLASGAYVLASGLTFLAVLAAAWKSGWAQAGLRWIETWTGRLTALRWLLIAALVLAPTGLVFYSSFGILFTGFWLRTVVVLGCGAAIAVLWPRETPSGLWGTWMLGSVLAGSALVLARYFHNVTAYPFSLSWSEGNRLWDYSVAFGRSRYIYPAGQSIFAYISTGRQTLWGLPFLIPGLTIWQERLWDAFLFTVPYALLGWAALRSEGGYVPRGWRLGFGLWAMVFLEQGPIYTPLVLSGILVALGLRSRRFWLLLILVALASYYAFLTRWTWMFAPAMWAGMVMLLEKPLVDVGRWDLRRVLRLAAVGVTGLLAGYILPNLVARWSVVGQALGAADIESAVSNQPLLWYRLLPNATLGPGILLALTLAAGGAAGFLLWAILTRCWRPGWLQLAGTLFLMVAFLAVGVVISAKIGGGSNLHNLDMFLVGMVFLCAAGLQGLARDGRLNSARLSAVGRVLLAAAVLLPVAAAGATGDRLRLPAPEPVEQALATIRAEVARYQQSGEVLFVDQRQLLAFGYVQGVPLVPDYEKKYLMDQALAGNAAYFKGLYTDLARRRFVLIVGETLSVNYQGSGHQFGEENDAWVRWVSEPMLCYYEPLTTLQGFNIQLLVPRAGEVDCTPPG
jgi:hypothetical protein